MASQYSHNHTTTNGGPATLVQNACRPLRVIVVGGGIASLVASIALRQNGHIVVIYEKSRFANETGAAIHAAPNATSALRHLGIDLRDGGAVPLSKMLWLNASNQEMRPPTDQAADAHRWESPWLLAHRASLHDQLKRKATALVGQGPPVKLHTSSPVIKVNPQVATVTLSNGEVLQADLIVGGDGVHSVTRSALGPNMPTARKGDQFAFRFTYARAVALADPTTRRLVEGEGVMVSWYGTDRKIVLYPTSNNTLLNFTASKNRLLEVYADFHPAVVKLLEKVEQDTVSLYPLYDMDQLPTFVSGRMALVGDAAHPFTPHLAQGGAMAIEDGLSLGTMLPSGTPLEEIETRMQLYNKARYERASAIQDYSRIVGGDSPRAKSQTGSTLKVLDFIEYGSSHDEYYASRKILRDYLSVRASSRLQNPLGFGLLQGPRQDLLGRSHADSLKISTSREASVRFTTSATVFRCLFPSDRYSFASRDTVQQASFTVQSLDGLAWLGGGGYDLVGLYIHGVRYQQTDSTFVTGKYCPVMIENLADPIITGREELGVPKVFSDIDIHRSDTTLHASLSWRGTCWAELHWSVLSPQSTGMMQAVSPAEDLLVHKYIPSSANKGAADANYAVLIKTASESCQVLGQQGCAPLNASFAFSSPEPHLIPTLSNVAQGLAEIPVFDIVRAGVVETKGVSDFSNLMSLG
ncbi:hypothetical protein LTR17_009568 [Elasticomyces elasticus]|nr:hypothetical protein LTR17_009568 [Elasticomyces elasticus]